MYAKTASANNKHYDSLACFCLCCSDEFKHLVDTIGLKKSSNSEGEVAVGYFFFQGNDIKPDKNRTKQ
jgi:hypothetical protein